MIQATTTGPADLLTESHWRRVVAVVALSAAAGLWAATWWGAGISPDTVSYVIQAENLVAGDGYRSAHFPPAYSALIALFGVAGTKFLDAARWIGIVTYFFSVLLFGLVLLENIAKHRWLAVLGSASFAISTLSIYRMGWSEPLFLFLLLCGIYCLTRNLRHFHFPWLLAAAAFIGLAALTRYAGIAFIGSGTATALFARRATIRRKTLGSFAFAVTASSPLGLWLLRNRLVLGKDTSREMIYHPIDGAKLRQAFDTLASWSFPGSWTLPRGLQQTGEQALLLFFVVAVIIALVGMRQTGWRDSPPLPLMMLSAIFAVVYLKFLVISISFFDAYTPLDGRILSPLLAVLILFLAALASHALPAVASRPVLVGTVIVFLTAHVVLGVVESMHDVRNAFLHGSSGFASKHWKTSPTLRRADELPAEAEIHSNAHDALYILTGRRAIRLPMEFIPQKEQSNPSFEREMERLAEPTEGKQVFVVYFDRIRRDYLPEETELRERLPLVLVAEERDGAIYRVTTIAESATPEGLSSPELHR